MLVLLVLEVGSSLFVSLRTSPHSRHVHWLLDRLLVSSSKGLRFLCTSFEVALKLMALVTVDVADVIPVSSKTKHHVHHRTSDFCCLL